MAAKNKPNLASAFDDLDLNPAPEPIAEAPQEEPPKPARKPSRHKTVLVGAHLPPKYGRALRMVAAQEDMTQQEIIQAALDMYLIAKGEQDLLARFDVKPEEGEEADQQV